MTRILDDELLSSFERSLARVGAAIVDHWAPGAGHSRFEELLAPLDIDLPEEARVWWGRHNGAAAQAPSAMSEVLPGRTALSLEQAIYLNEAFSGMGAELYGMPEADKHLQLVGGEPLIYVACHEGRDVPSPIYYMNDVSDAPRPLFASLGDLITLWIELLDTGAFRTKADGTWHWPDGGVSPSIRALGIG